MERKSRKFILHCCGGIGEWQFYSFFGQHQLMLTSVFGRHNGCKSGTRGVFCKDFRESFRDMLRNIKKESVGYMRSVVTSSWVLSLMLAHATNWSTNWSKSRTWSKAGVCTVSLLTSFSHASAVALSTSFFFFLPFFFFSSFFLCASSVAAPSGVPFFSFPSHSLCFFLPGSRSFSYLSRRPHARMDCLSLPPTPITATPTAVSAYCVCDISFLARIRAVSLCFPLLPHFPLSSLFSPGV